MGGRNAWLHVAVAESATCYQIGRRSSDVLASLLGGDWSGTLIHDGLAVYDRLEKATHQQCLQHLLRRCEQVRQMAPGTAKGLAAGITDIVQEAFRIRRAWRGHRIGRDQLAEAWLELTGLLDDWTSGRYSYEPNRRLAQHVQNHLKEWFWFLLDPNIDATNYRAEQALRPAVVNRKVWGGNRTDRGSRVQEILMTVLMTLIQRGYSLLDWLVACRCALVPLPLPP